MATDSTTSKERSKRRKASVPKKPYTDFPLSAHSRGFWYKTIDGKMHYFGRWGRMVDKKFVRFEGEGYEAEWKKSKALYESQSDDFKTGTIRTMDKPNDGGKVTVAVLCFKFMRERQKDLEAKKIGQPMLKEYMSLCQTILAVFGEGKLVESLGPADFQTLRREFESRLGANRLANTITWTKTIFAFAYDMELIEKPIRCLSRTNKIFQPPTKREKRREEAAKPKKLLTPAQCKLLINTAPAPLKAWILLGLNAGFGPMDCAQLPVDRIDFKNKLIDWPRPKTGIDRRAFCGRKQSPPSRKQSLCDRRQNTTRPSRWCSSRESVARLLDRRPARRTKLVCRSAV